MFGSKKQPTQSSTGRKATHKRDPKSGASNRAAARRAIDQSVADDARRAQSRCKGC